MHFVWKSRMIIMYLPTPLWAQDQKVCIYAIAWHFTVFCLCIQNESETETSHRTEWILCFFAAMAKIWKTFWCLSACVCAELLRPIFHTHWITNGCKIERVHWILCLNKCNIIINNAKTATNWSHWMRKKARTGEQWPQNDYYDYLSIYFAKSDYFSKLNCNC